MVEAYEIQRTRFDPHFRAAIRNSKFITKIVYIDMDQTDVSMESVMDSVDRAALKSRFKRIRISDANSKTIPKPSH